MPYFLDGNNLIGHARGTAQPSDEDRQSFISEIAERLRKTRAQAVLFFDGPGEKRTFLGNLSIREAGPRGADEAILREIGRTRTPREVVVVTADRELVRRSRDAGAKSLSPAEFWSRFGVSTRAESPDAAAKVDVEDWLKYFGDEKNREG
jgi:predicted RNA-binding protein with PIN domain